jgi:hypothetical protein
MNSITRPASPARSSCISSEAEHGRAVTFDCEDTAAA